MTSVTTTSKYNKAGALDEKRYQITVGFRAPNAKRFVAWLNFRGHNAAIGFNSVERVDGIRTDDESAESNAAASIMQTLLKKFALSNLEDKGRTAQLVKAKPTNTYEFGSPQLADLHNRAKEKDGRYKYEFDGYQYIVDHGSEKTLNIIVGGSRTVEMRPL